MRMEMETGMTMKTILCSLLLLLPMTACSTEQHAMGTPAVAQQEEVRIHYSACTEDRRKDYKTIEVPSVTQTRGVPTAFLQQLQTEIIEFGRQHNVWQVVPTTPDVNNVVVLAMIVESWEPNATATGDSGALAMRLELIDKAKQS